MVAAPGGPRVSNPVSSSAEVTCEPKVTRFAFRGWRGLRIGSSDPREIGARGGGVVQTGGGHRVGPSDGRRCRAWRDVMM
jgi:hypothetical protein